MTLSLNPHRKGHFLEILTGILDTQNRLSITKRHKVLGELRSVDFSLPGARGLFIKIQEALHQINGKRFTIKRGIHEALEYLLWITKDIDAHLIRMYVPT